MAGTFQFVGQYATATGSQTWQPATATIATPIGSVTSVALASGANTITVPAGTTFICIQLPTTNTIVVTLKGVTGDTGIALHKTAPFVLAQDPAANANFVLTAASAIAAFTTITFI